MRSVGTFRKSLAAGLILLCAHGTANAQGFVDAAVANRPPEELDETDLRMRFDVTGGGYVESQYGDAPVPNTSITSPNAIFWLDLRGKADARHISGSNVDGVADLRIRLNPDPNAPSRGYRGGEEYDLKEAYGVYRGGSMDFGVGRQIIREVDAQTIDGATLVYRPSERYQLGLFGGLYPDPFSRSLQEDYRVVVYDSMNLPSGTATVSPIPLAAGGWGGYRFPRGYGAVGAAAILPRNDDVDQTMPSGPARSENRVLLTSQGYWRTFERVNVIHYLVGEARHGDELPQILNAQLALHWRFSEVLLLELGASRLSSFAVEVYLRDLLERLYPYAAPCPDMTTRCIQNNINIVRVGSNELRLGGNYLFPGPRLDVNAQLRYREREGLVLPEGLPVFNADQQLEVTLGARKKAAVSDFDVSAIVTVMRGKRSAVNVGGVRATRNLSQALYLELDAGFSQYQDECLSSLLDLRTCDGTARGRTFRIGALATWQKSANWLLIGDYHLNVNKASALRMITTDTFQTDDYPYFAGHSIFLRSQYRY